MIKRPNTLVTRGMGRHNNLVTKGFVRGFLDQIVVTAQRVIRHGRSSARRAIEDINEIIVWAKLIEVNHKPSPIKIQGFIKINLDKLSSYASTLVEYVSSRVRSTYEDIKITVKRLR